jgi:hypothetical protein
LLDSLLLPPAPLVAHVAGWFEDTRNTHERAIDAALARERHLHDRPTARSGIQPGLFDRRALDAEARRDQVESGLAAEHAQRITALQRARPLDLVIEPIAVLVAWR